MHPELGNTLYFMLNEKIINKLIINVPHHKYDGFGKKGRKKKRLNTMHARIRAVT
jgi:hypothetical protein